MLDPVQERAWELSRTTPLSFAEALEVARTEIAIERLTGSRPSVLDTIRACLEPFEGLAAFLQEAAGLRARRRRQIIRRRHTTA